MAKLNHHMHMHTGLTAWHVQHYLWPESFHQDKDWSREGATLASYSWKYYICFRLTNTVTPGHDTVHRYTLMRHMTCTPMLSSWSLLCPYMSFWMQDDQLQTTCKLCHVSWCQCLHAKLPGWLRSSARIRSWQLSWKLAWWWGCVHTGQAVYASGPCHSCRFWDFAFELTRVFCSTSTSCFKSRRHLATCPSTALLKNRRVFMDYTCLHIAAHHWTAWAWSRVPKLSTI